MDVLASTSPYLAMMLASSSRRTFLLRVALFTRRILEVAVSGVAEMFIVAGSDPGFTGSEFETFAVSVAVAVLEFTSVSRFETLSFVLAVLAVLAAVAVLEFTSVARFVTLAFVVLNKQQLHAISGSPLAFMAQEHCVSDLDCLRESVLLFLLILFDSAISWLAVASISQSPELESTERSIDSSSSSSTHGSKEPCSVDEAVEAVEMVDPLDPGGGGVVGP